MFTYVATIDACMMQEKPHEPHLRQTIPWPGSRRSGEWLWCLGEYDQQRQTRRVVVRSHDGAETLVGEGLSVVGSAYRIPRETRPEAEGGCGECREPEDFDWDPTRWENDGPVIVCHVHGALAPGWVYDGDVEVGLNAWRNPERTIP